MKIQWQIYKKLELIPDAVLQPEAQQGLLARMIRPIQRSLADAVVRELDPEPLLEHLESCLVTVAKMSQASPSAPENKLEAQPPLNNNSQPWWIWYDS
jgi:hypothetical protein